MFDLNSEDGNSVKPQKTNFITEKRGEDLSFLGDFSEENV